MLIVHYSMLLDAFFLYMQTAAVGVWQHAKDEGLTQRQIATTILLTSKLFFFDPVLAFPSLITPAQGP